MCHAHSEFELPEFELREFGGHCTNMHMRMAPMHGLSGGQLACSMQELTPTVLTPCQLSTNHLETDVPHTLGIRITGIRIAVGTAHICIYVRPACVRCAHPRQLQCWPFSNSHAQPIHGLIPAEWAVQLPTTDAIAEFQLRTHAYACICTRYSATMTLRALGDSRSSPALGRMHMEGIT